MTDPEFVAWLNEEVAGARMTPHQRDDLLSQKQLFDDNLGRLESDFQNQIVGYVAGQLLVDRDLHSLLATAGANYPGSMIYFEPIGFDLF